MVKEIYGLEFEPGELEKLLKVQEGLVVIDSERLDDGTCRVLLDQDEESEEEIEEEIEDEKPQKKQAKGRKSKISDKDFKKVYNDCSGNVKQICEVTGMKYPTVWKKANDIKKAKAVKELVKSKKEKAREVERDLESVDDLED